MSKSYSRFGFITFFSLILALHSSGCFNLDDDGEESTTGLAPTLPGEGPQVVFEPIVEKGEAPNVPYGDFLLRNDSTTPTGKRFNISEEAGVADFEKSLRHRINFMDGLGTFSTVPISFDRAIDLSTVNYDTVYWIQLEDCERHKAGTRWPVAIYDPRPELDHRGYFPTKLQTASLGHRRDFFLNDLQDRSLDSLFIQEYDLNQNGTCDYIDEDWNFNGKCEWAGNHFDIDKDGDLDYITYYEMETNTLLLRPTHPLDQQCSFAIVLTRGITGVPSEGSALGLPIRSPWEFVNHTTQTNKLEKVLPYLESYGVNDEDIAFAMTYTTGTQTKVLEKMIACEGPFEFLCADPKFETKITKVYEHGKPKELGQGNPYIIKAEPFAVLGLILGGLIIDGSAGVELSSNLLRYTDYFVIFDVQAPYFLQDENLPEDHPENDPTKSAILIELDGTNYTTGKKVAPKVNTKKRVACVIPKPRPELGCEAPFPIIFHEHGYTSDFLELFGFAASYNKHCFAACTMNAAHHGPQEDFVQGGLVNVVGDLVGGELSDAALRSLFLDDMIRPEILALFEEFVEEEIIEKTFKETYSSNEKCNETFEKDCLEVSSEEKCQSLYKESCVDVINAQCQALWQKDCSEATAQELLSALADSEKYLAESLCNLIQPGGSVSKTDNSVSEIQQILNAIDLSAFAEKTLGVDVSKDCKAKVEKYLSKHGDNLDEILTKAVDLVINVIKTFFIWQATFYVPGVDRISDIPINTDASDILEKIAFSPLFYDILGTGEAVARAYGRDAEGNIDLESGYGKGTLKSGGDFWSADIGHTRSVVEQSVIDFNFVINTILSFSTSKFEPPYNGDFNEDGVVDIGGPFHCTGSSLGGILCQVAAPIIPHFTSTAPSSGFAGATDVGVRTFQGGVWQAVNGELWCSPCVSSIRGEGGEHQLMLSFSDVNDDVNVPLAQISADLAIKIPKGFATLENLRNGDRKTVRINSGGIWRVSVRTDLHDPLRLILSSNEGYADNEFVDLKNFDPNKNKFYEIEFKSPVRGWGFERNTPGFRRFYSIAQHVIDSRDGVNFGIHGFTGRVPIDHSVVDFEGNPFTVEARRFSTRTNDLGIYNLFSIGDSNVPCNTGWTYSRVMGAISHAQSQQDVQSGITECVVGSAFVNAEGKVCMEGTPGCEVTYNRFGQSCDPGEPCYDIIPVSSDPIAFPVSDESTNNPSPEGCSPVDPSSRAGEDASACTPSQYFVTAPDGNVVPVSGVPSVFRAPMEITPNDSGEPFQIVSRATLMSGIEGWHGVWPASPRNEDLDIPGFTVKMPNETDAVEVNPQENPNEPKTYYNWLYFDWGTYETNRIAWFFKTGNLIDDACMAVSKSDPETGLYTCDKYIDGFPPTAEINLGTTLKGILKLGN